MVIFNRNNQVFTALNHFSFYQLWIKEAGAICMELPAVISKGESLWAPKGLDLRFKRTNSHAFAKVLEGLYKLCQLNLNNVVSIFNHAWALGVVRAVKLCKTSQTAQTCWSSWPVKWVSWSLWSFRAVPHGGIIFSNRTLATEEAVVYLQSFSPVRKHTDHD